MAHYLISTQRNKTAYDLASTSEVRHCLTEKPVRNRVLEWNRAVFKRMISLYMCVCRLPSKSHRLVSQLEHSKTILYTVYSYSIELLCQHQHFLICAMSTFWMYSEYSLRIAVLDYWNDKHKNTVWHSIKRCSYIAITACYDMSTDSQGEVAIIHTCTAICMLLLFSWYLTISEP